MDIVYKHNKNNKKPFFRFTKRNILILSILVALFAVGVVSFMLSERSNQPNTQNTPPDTETRNSDTPFEGEQEYRDLVEGSSPDDTKERILQEQQNSVNTSQGSKKSVTPIITSAFNESGTINVRGFVDGIVENDGQCTFVFTGGSTIKKGSSGTAGSSSVNCMVTIPRTSLPGNSWEVYLSYDSSRASGSSQPIKVGL